VKPYVKRQKNDMADAEAICEAVTRANMRFVPIKTPEQQSGLVLHRTRHLFIRQQTSVIHDPKQTLREEPASSEVFQNPTQIFSADLCRWRQIGLCCLNERHLLTASASRALL
jgi:hypothetical protein